MLTLGEFRKLTHDLPDNTHILLDQGDLDMYDAQHSMTLPPALNHPHAITLVMGQVWNHELDIDARIDAVHMRLGLE